jgi:putative flippase GtrA
VVGVPVLAANVVSFSVAVCSNFLLNRHWTFRSHRQRHVAVGGGLFLLGALVGLALNEAGLWALQSAHVHWVLAKLAMTAVVLCWNYAFNASVTFRKTEHHSQAGLEAAKVEHP